MLLTFLSLGYILILILIFGMSKYLTSPSTTHMYMAWLVSHEGYYMSDCRFCLRFDRNKTTHTQHCHCVTVHVHVCVCRSMCSYIYLTEMLWLREIICLWIWRQSRPREVCLVSWLQMLSRWHCSMFRIRLIQNMVLWRVWTNLCCSLRIHVFDGAL